MPAPSAASRPASAPAKTSLLSRQEFLQHLEGRDVDVVKAKADPRLQEANGGGAVEKADLDGDGKLTGAAEHDALFTAVDQVDRNGTKRSVKLATKSGETAVAPALTAVADLAGARTLAARVKRGIADAKRSAPTAAENARLPDTQPVADAAKKLAEERGLDYGVPAKWVNSDPTHNAPVGRPIHGTEDKWKCNLFGGNSLANAGFEVPKYGNPDPQKGERGEYPNANQWHKWSDEYAPEIGNKVHFQLKGEMDPSAYPAGPERERAIAEFLKDAKPGDIVTVDHAGTDVADGGHVRVVVGNTLKTNPPGAVDAEGNPKPAAEGALIAAQARQDRAKVEHDGVSDFTGEERIWILRPIRPAAAQAVGNS